MSTDETLNQEIITFGFKRDQSKFNDNKRYTTIQFEINGEKRILFTGSKVTMEQLEKYHEYLPFVTTIRKINRYYTLT